MHDGSITILCKGELDEMEGLQQTISRFCKLHGVPAKYHHSLNLALDEVLTNVVRHGFSAESPHEIRVRIDLTGNELSAEVEDAARAFDPTAHPRVDCAKPMEDRLPGGLGIHLVRSLVTRLAYRREDGKNILTLTKRVS